MDDAKETEMLILNDYATVGLRYSGALVSRDVDPVFLRGVVVAHVASQLGISLTHADRTYVKHLPDLSPQTAQARAFRTAYSAAMGHIESTIRRFDKMKPMRDPTAGELFSDVALRRSEASFSAAGLLFRVGHMFEARAVARMLLEQIAWAYAVREVPRADVASKLRATRAVGNLCTILPESGRLYGLLSDESHIGLDSHYRFIQPAPEGTQVIIGHGPDSHRSGLVLLNLADYWSIVYEVVQAPFMTTLENWAETDRGLVLRSDRPFLAKVGQILDAATD